MKKHVGFAYIAGFIFEAPLFCLYMLLGVLLCREAGMGAFGLMLLCSAKPLVALFSSYWRGTGRRQIMATSLLSGAFPLIFPWIQSPSIYLMGFACFFLCQRSSTPPWMELLRLHASKEERSFIVSRGALVGYLAGALIPFVIGPLLDQAHGLYPWLFALAGLISLLRLPMQWVLLPEGGSLIGSLTERSQSWLLHPWKESFSLLKRRPDFAWYQALFLLGGLGLMVMQPALPLFVTRELGLTYTQTGLAFAGAKGMGFIIATPFARRLFSKLSIYHFSGGVTAIAALSLGFMLSASFFVPVIYVAFFCYGLMQAASHLSWHLAGPYFSGEENSAPYTSVNVAFVGIRGLVGPFIGSLLVMYVGLFAPFVCGIGLCCIGSIMAFSKTRTEPHAQIRS